MKRLAPLVILAFIITGCDIQSIYFSITREKSDYFTEEEKVILNATTAALGFDNGYDPDMDIDYVNSFKHSTPITRAARAKMRAQLAKLDRETLTSYYEKIYGLVVMTKERVYYYKKMQDWSNHTFTKKYLLPPLMDYFNILEDYLFKVNREYAENSKKKKKVLRKKVLAHVREKRAAEEAKAVHCP
jgi:hypothetical protein